MSDQTAPAEIEAALDRYADFATDTNRKRVMDSINDLRVKLAAEVEETKAWRKTATFRAELLSTAEADLKTRTKELGEAQAKLEARDDDALSHCLRGNDLQAELDQSQAKITSLELDKARLVESICNFLRLLISTATIGERDKLEQVVPSKLRRLLMGDKS